jgi:hypothetical protein
LVQSRPQANLWLQHLALCLRAFGADTIYTLAPSYTGQAPFAYQKYKGESLYVYANVERKRQRIEVRLGRDAEEKTKSKSLPTFTIRSTKQRRWIQNRNGNVVATVDRMVERIDEGTGHHNFVAYTNSRLTISPGLDPCLVVFIAAMVDEMDARRRQARMDMCANMFVTY